MTLFKGNLGISEVWILVALNSNRRAAPTKKGSSAGAFLFYRSLHWCSFNATVRPDMTKITCARSSPLKIGILFGFKRHKKISKIQISRKAKQKTSCIHCVLNSKLFHSL